MDMRTFRDAQAMAIALRRALTEREIYLSRGDCLELVAHQFGFPDWAAMADAIEQQQASD
jgi:hypothetical protein